MIDDQERQADRPSVIGHRPPPGANSRFRGKDDEGRLVNMKRVWHDERGLVVAGGLGRLAEVLG
jgi:hypothetical protein